MTITNVDPLSASARHRQPPVSLGDLLNPFPVSDFCRDYLGKTFRYVPGIVGKFSSLLSWTDLNGILERGTLTPPRLRLVKDGSELPIESFSKVARFGVAGISASDLQSRLREGATLLIDSIDEVHAPVRLLSEALERALRVRVHVNMYATWCTSCGFNLHWDDHDVFILQLRGTKQWQIHGESESFPLDRNHKGTLKPPENGPVWERVLQDGDMLYIPRGWWHVAIPCNQPTLHLTVGMTYPTGLSLFRWVSDRLRADETMRMDLPLLADSEMQAKHMSKVREAVSRVFDEPNLFASFLSYLDDIASPVERLVSLGAQHPVYYPRRTIG